MSAQPVGPDRPAVTYQRLGEYAEAFVAVAENRGDLVRADIANQEITVRMMSPSNSHGEIVSEVVFQVRSQDRDAVGLVENRVHRPDLGLCRSADLLILTREVRDRQKEEFGTFGPTPPSPSRSCPPPTRATTTSANSATTHAWAYRST
ncbi:hypothetical protein SALBM135S_04968 [Streptomyces alboniger]